MYLCDINIVVVKVVCKVVDVYIEKILDKLCFVVGVFGLINCIVFILLDVNDLGKCNVMFDELVEVYSEFIEVLIEGGVDFIMFEIIFDMLNVKVVVYVVDSVFEKLNVILFVMVLGIIIDVLG